MDDLTIATDGLVLRPPTEADIPDIVAACSDALTQRWLPNPARAIPGKGRPCVRHLQRAGADRARWPDVVGAGCRHRTAAGQCRRAAGRARRRGG
ncbi:GNAT family N-acetyltransferase [Fodinicola feengrottensis]|uniref:GNAT family N-acetyltransferase n=1 Tax=Fodinicola feengrottensis TaxID=435914 RepID=UPI002442E7F1|nr:hypothetical protein [Fodinicola feengrottensis]